LDFILKIFVALIWAISTYYLQFKDVIAKDNPELSKLISFYVKSSKTKLSEIERTNLKTFIQTIARMLDQLSIKLLFVLVLITIMTFKFAIFDYIYPLVILGGIFCSVSFYISIFSKWVLSHSVILKGAIKDPFKILVAISFSLSFYITFKSYPNDPMPTAIEILNELQLSGAKEFLTNHYLDFIYIAICGAILYASIWIIAMSTLAIASVPLMLAWLIAKIFNKVFSQSYRTPTFLILWVTSSLYFMW